MSNPKKCKEANYDLDELNIVEVHPFTVLQQMGVDTLDQLCSLSVNDMLRQRSVGTITIARLRLALFEIGRTFRKGVDFRMHKREYDWLKSERDMYLKWVKEAKEPFADDWEKKAASNWSKTVKAIERLMSDPEQGYKK